MIHLHVLSCWNSVLSSLRGLRYSRLMDEDEAGTHRAAKTTFRELVEPKADHFRGRIIKGTDDGVLMEFASAVDAVAFAVEVQCRMRERNQDVPEDRQILLRIGVNIGDIIIEPDDKRKCLAQAGQSI